MDARLHRRIQRYGWDLAAGDYEALWGRQLAPVQSALIESVAIRSGDRVLDVACGTGAVTLAAAGAVGTSGHVVGIDISGQMVSAANRVSTTQRASSVEFARMDAEAIEFADESFDVVLCSLGLMYMPDPEQSIREMRRVLRPGGRLALSVWGERRHCGWADLFGIVQDEVRSEVCPMFFRLGQDGALERACEAAHLIGVERRKISQMLDYADEQEACRAAFSGGPVALAWSRFDDATRARVMQRYIRSIEPWRSGSSYRVPAEFQVAAFKQSA